MRDRKKNIGVILLIAVITIAAIVCVNMGLGYVLRNAQIVDVYYVYDNTEYETEYETKYEGMADPLFNDPVLIPIREHSEGWKKGPLQKSSIQVILNMVNIALIGAGVFAYLIYLSIKNRDDRKTIKLFCLLGAFVLLAVIVISCMFNNYAHKTYTEEHYYNAGI